MNQILENQHFSPTSRSLITGAALVILVLGMRAMALFCNAAFLAVVITITLTPIVNRLKQRGWSRSVAAGLVILMLMLIILILLLLMVYSAEQLISTLATLDTPVIQTTGAVNAFFSRYNIDVNNTTIGIEKLVLTGLRQANNSLSNITALVSTFGLAFLASAFMLLESDNFSNQLARKFGSDSSMMLSATRFMQGTRDFILITTILGLLQGVLVAIILYIVGVPLPIVWGILFWMLNYIPYIGFWLAMLPPVILAGTFLGWQYAMLVLIIYVVISNVFKLLVMPKVMGDKVDTSMTVGFLSLFFWGFTFGVVGMLLAYPYTLLVRDVILSSTNEFWLVDLMRKGDPRPDEGA